MQEARMKTAKVSVVPYDASWTDEFLKIKGEIEDAIGDIIIGIEHVGSTAVEGMYAKPCIDIDVIIRDRSALAEVIEKLNTVGYVHEGDLGIKDREAFAYEDKPHLYKHHLYVCPIDSVELYRHVTFRNFLRATPAAAQEYSRIKKEAAALHPDSIDKYIEHKSPTVKKLYALCGLE